MSAGAHTPGRGSRPKHVPMRRCLACRASRPQAELVRLVQEEGQWQLDPGSKAPGRGAWLCRDSSECHSAKALKRSLKGQAERVANELRGYFEGRVEVEGRVETQAGSRLEPAGGAQPEASKAQGSRAQGSRAQGSRPGRVRVNTATVNSATNESSTSESSRNGTTKNGNSRNENGGPNA
jgi:predicted RNA-binding protein YlxR (DUF448 family)